MDSKCVRTFLSLYRVSKHTCHMPPYYFPICPNVVIENYFHAFVLSVDNLNLKIDEAE
jgi:hypothetical protein